MDGERLKAKIEKKEFIVEMNFPIVTDAKNSILRYSRESKARGLASCEKICKFNTTKRSS